MLVAIQMVVGKWDTRRGVVDDPYTVVFSFGVGTDQAGTNCSSLAPQDHMNNSPSMLKTPLVCIPTSSNDFHQQGYTRFGVHPRHFIAWRCLAGSWPHPWMLTEELRARCLVWSCLVHMAAKDADGILTAAETLRWGNVAFQPLLSPPINKR
jgi:hypothetical protein